MPIDPSIPLAVKPFSLNVGGALQAGQNMAIQQEQARALAEQRKAQAALREQQTKALELQAAEDAVLMEVFGQIPLDQIKPSHIYGKVNPKRAGEIWKGIRDLRMADFGDAEKVRTSMLTRIGAIKALPEAMRQPAYEAVVQDYVGKGLIDPQQIKPYSTETLDAYEFELLTPEQREARNKKPNLIQRDPSKPLVNPQTGEEVVPADPKAVEVDLSKSDLRIQAADALRRGDQEAYKRILKAAEDVGKADDRAFRPFAPVVVMTDSGPQVVDRSTRQAAPITSADGKQVGMAPTAEERNRAGAGKRAQPVLSAITELSEKINTGQGVIAKITGFAEKAAAQANLQDDISEYEAVVSGFTPLLARMMGHVGVLTEQDVQSVRRMLPNPSDSKSVRDRKIARINTILGGTEAPNAAQNDAKKRADDLIKKYGGGD